MKNMKIEAKDMGWHELGFNQKERLNKIIKKKMKALRFLNESTRVRRL